MSTRQLRAVEGEVNQPAGTADPIGLAHPRDLDQAPVVEGDPGKSAQALGLERMQALVKEFSSGGLGNLTELRDAVDNLMRAIKQEGEELTRRFGVYAAHVQAAVEMRGIVEQPIADLSKEVTASLTPPPGRVVTQQQ